MLRYATAAAGNPVPISALDDTGHAQSPSLGEGRSGRVLRRKSWGVTGSQRIVSPSICSVCLHMTGRRQLLKDASVCQLGGSVFVQANCTGLQVHIQHMVVQAG